MKRTAIAIIASVALPVMAAEPEFAIEVGWDSKYVSEGRNNLPHGGIGWAGASATVGDLTAYALVGRADAAHFTEWNFGVEYQLHLHDTLEAFVGAQRIENYGDVRCSDNELFAELAWTAWDYLVPSIAYTYSTEAGGYFVELSLHSNWHLGEQFILSPYLTQGFDFQYVTEDHNGANHLQFGLEATWAFSDNLSVSAQVSRVIAGKDIEVDQGEEARDETFAGVRLAWAF
ncbi:hypothetical protein [Shewanella litorisediminis]|uniref:Uncharacterized protein n=1 Tax=Shewanella litorisediminis TaxID=1173586 RepID=A0ABX7G349_9GAMM|nr:hypothetical protein [Shewanella litorisediminis]MCL2917285.1 hypothetical protein [Shewanella litorisediminis]QRH01755.1 hypothetical protein JQC75_18235 [Shewanella litorisediminis]